MILFDGRLFLDEELSRIMEELPGYCVRAAAQPYPEASEVIRACGILSEKIVSGEYDDVIKPLLLRGVFTEEQLEEAAAFFRKENLEYKYRIELGEFSGELEDICPPGGLEPIRRRRVPLGILFHIAAGNAEGLPFYSVIEGLLAGNVNILKLPSADDGLSIFLLKELVGICPGLAPYVSVLDISSSDVELLKRLGRMADALVVWGGDAAVQAARTLADPATQIISWGHKLSFAYVSGETDTDRAEGELRGLAAHICATNQLLCSSCQGIFLDTESFEETEELGRRFLGLLEEERQKRGELSVGIRGKVGIALYNEELESIWKGHRVLRGRGVSVTVSRERTLELSCMFGNCWIKPLPGEKIVETLKPYRGYLQTAGLLCEKEDRAFLEEALIRAGVVRITRPGEMSRTVSGEAHDGEYALRRYSRIAEIDG